MAQSFGYARPKYLGEAFDILDSYGTDASPLAGGTDLIVGVRTGRIAPRILVDLKRITDLFPGICSTDGGVSIAAPTTLTDIIADDLIRRHFPALVQAAGTIGSVQIRNRATLTGNICNASPAADTAPALLAYGAEVVLVSREGSRPVRLEEFFLGPRRTSLRAGEIAAGVQIPIPVARTGSHFARLTRRRGVDLATISLCCAVGTQVTRFAFGAVGPKPFVLSDDSGVLANPDSEPAARLEVLRHFVGSAAPISDLRGSRLYRQAMLMTLSQRALTTAIAHRDRA
ncbi:MAG TPA: xanthine dehydrogenase family protein subunit M [Streptosporangiaceae bacterium]|nr:xanthine dehydrogenase family protein subunit M [Streptosporangiaceae bacterium]